MFVLYSTGIHLSKDTNQFANFNCKENYVIQELFMHTNNINMIKEYLCKNSSK